MNIGKTVIRLRKQAKLNQSQLAEKAGVPQSTLSEIENNINGATGKTLVKLAAALNCSVDDLLDINKTA